MHDFHINMEFAFYQQVGIDKLLSINILNWTGSKFRTDYNCANVLKDFAEQTNYFC